MPTHADKHRAATTEFTWWLAWPVLGAAVWAWRTSTWPARWLARRTAEWWGDLHRPSRLDEPHRMDRWLLVGLAAVAVLWLTLLAVAG